MIFYALNRNDVVVARLELRRYNNTYQVRASVVNDGTSWSNSAWFTITNAPHKLEIDWRASSGPGTNNGGITFWVDDVQRGNFTNIDNDTRLVDYVQWGAVSGVDSGTRGTYYFDDFISRRESYIGMLNIPRRAVAQDGLPGAAKVLAAPAPVHLPSPPTVPPQGDVVFAPLEQSQAITTTTVITYTYDPLDRLVAADYSDGTYFYYEYDAVGNRLSEETTSGITYYEYDEANRLIEVWGQGYAEYTWDDNGNLLDDGPRSYTYDHANRLVGVSGAELSISYGYNGLGDRLTQTVDSVTTEYALDLAAGLTQVLADGTNTYLYGLSRIGEEQSDGWQYYLGDALGSVRQLTDEAGEVSLAKSYMPYGEAITSAGGAASAYGYTGEWVDSYIELVYLRARWYAPSDGRFLTRDVWEGNKLRPMSYNQWLYGYGNPINQIDPSGYDSYCDSPYADPEECDFEPPEDGIPGCGEICMNEATKPLKTWGELYTFTNPERALSIRLLLAEIGWRIVANANWQVEGNGILWTVRNRVRWEELVKAGDKTKYSRFYTCDVGFTKCALRQGQYATTTTTRGRDPLYLDPDEPGRRRSYYHDTKYIPIAIERAFLVATKFLYGSAPDPTNTDGRGGARFFSHKPAPNTHFSRQVDVFCGEKYKSSYLE